MSGARYMLPVVNEGGRKQFFVDLCRDGEGSIPTCHFFVRQISE